MDELENVAAEAAPQDTSAPETQPDLSEEALDAELSQIYAKDNPLRDGDGKFANRDGSEDTAEGDKPADTVSEGQPETKAQETEKPSIPPPNSWSSEVKEKWNALPPDLQEYVARRESESHKAITSMGEKVKALEPFSQLIEANKDVFSRHNAQPVQGIASLIDVQRQLDSDPYGTIAKIAHMKGVDLSVFANGQQGEQGNQSPQVASLQAQLQAERQRVDQLSQLVLTREERESQAHQQRVQQTAQEFLAKVPLSEEQETRLAEEVEFVKLRNPHLSAREWLDMGFERFQKLDPSFTAQKTAQERAAEETRKQAEAQKRATEAKRSSNINVRGTPGQHRPAPSLDDELSQIYRSMRA